MTTAQYDDLDDLAITRLAQLALERYSASLQGDLRLLCRSENATFLLIASGKRYALRIHRDNYHQKDEIESELSWLDALRQDMDMAVPHAIPDRSGERVLTVALPDGAVRHAVLFHWIEGSEPTSDVDPQAFRQLGKITAQLHQHSRGWRKPEGFRRIEWTHESMVGLNGHWGHWSEMPGFTADNIQLIRDAVAKIGQALSQYGRGADHFGLIHADLRLTNLLLHEGSTRVIDFDDCGMGWYLHDLAAATSFEEHHPSAPLWAENWLNGYEQVAHIDDAGLAVLPSMLIQRRIQLTAWMASHAATATARSLAAHWAADTVRLARIYMDGGRWPLGE